MKEIELLLELGDSTELEFLLDTLRDMRERVGDTEVLNRMMNVCNRIIEGRGDKRDFPNQFVQQLKKERDNLLIRQEFEHYKRQQEQVAKQQILYQQQITQQQLSKEDLSFQSELANAMKKRSQKI